MHLQHRDQVSITVMSRLKDLERKEKHSVKWQLAKEIAMNIWTKFTTPKVKTGVSPNLLILICILRLIIQ